MADTQFEERGDQTLSFQSHPPQNPQYLSLLVTIYSPFKKPVLLSYVIPIQT